MKTKDWMVVSCSCDGCTSIILQGYRQYHKSEVESFVDLPWISLLRWLTAWQHQPREDPGAKELSNHSDQTRPRQAHKLYKCRAVNRMPGEMHVFKGHHLFHWATSLNICMSPMSSCAAPPHRKSIATSSAPDINGTATKRSHWCKHT